MYMIAYDLRWSIIFIQLAVCFLSPKTRKPQTPHLLFVNVLSLKHLFYYKILSSNYSPIPIYLQLWMKTKCCIQSGACHTEFFHHILPFLPPKFLWIQCRSVSCLKELLLRWITNEQDFHNHFIWMCWNIILWKINSYLCFLY